MKILRGAKTSNFSGPSEALTSGLISEVPAGRAGEHLILAARRGYLHSGVLSGAAGKQRRWCHLLLGPHSHTLTHPTAA